MHFLRRKFRHLVRHGAGCGAVMYHAQDATPKNGRRRLNVSGVRRFFGYGALAFCAIFLCALASFSAGAPGGAADGTTGGKPDDLGVEVQKEFLGKMKDINRDLTDEHANFAKNYTLMSPLYDRLQTDWKTGATTPSDVLVNLQVLQRKREDMQARIEELEKKKTFLSSSIASHYDNNIPATLQQALDEEEKKCKAAIDDIYLQLGWWLQTQKSEFGERDEMSLRQNILRYHRERSKPEE